MTEAQPERPEVPLDALVGAATQEGAPEYDQMLMGHVDAVHEGARLTLRFERDQKRDPDDPDELVEGERIDYADTLVEFIEYRALVRALALATGRPESDVAAEVTAAVEQYA